MAFSRRPPRSRANPQTSKFGARARGSSASGTGAEDEPEAGAHGTDEKPQPSAFTRGLGMLARREHSSREIKRKLAQKGYEREESADALEKLQALEFQSDERFGGALIRTRIAQGYGPRRIAYEVRGHGLTDVEVRALIEAEAPDWLAIARANYRRKYGSRPAADPAERANRAQFLLRRGFDAATVRTVTRADDVDDSADEFE